MIGVAMILLYIIICKVKDCQKINYDEDEKSMGTYKCNIEGVFYDFSR